MKLYQNQVEDCIPLNYALSVSTEEAGKSSDITEHRQTWESPCTPQSVCQVSQYLT